jgi:hypothetical protein
MKMQRADCRLSLRGHRKRFVDVIISQYGLCPIPTDSYLFGTVSLPAVARVTSLSRLQMIVSALVCMARSSMQVRISSG